MRTCKHCKIEVGGSYKKCPFCQNALIGEPSPDHWPKHNVLKAESFFYKLQLFIVLSAIIVALALDFLFKCFGSKHYSLLFAMWIIVFEVYILNLFKRKYSASRIMTLFAVTVCLLLMITTYYVGGFGIMMDYILPLVIIGLLIANFVLALVGDISNAMVYLLVNIGIGILPYIALLIMGKNIAFLWMISLIVSLIVLVGACIFKGRAVVNELVRRFNI